MLAGRLNSSPDDKASTQCVSPSSAAVGNPNREPADVAAIRQSVLEVGLPFLFVEELDGFGAVTRKPVSRFFRHDLRGARTEHNIQSEVKANASILESSSKVFLELSERATTLPLGCLGDLAKRLPETDLFLSSIIQWPEKLNTNIHEYRVICTAALFQAGFFVPQDKPFAQHMLVDIFPEFSRAFLPNALTECLSLAVTGHDEPILIEALLDFGADPNRFTAEGSLPLNEALLHTNIEAIKLLLERGAKILPDSSQETVWDILRDEFDPEQDHEVFRLFPGFEAKPA